MSHKVCTNCGAPLPAGQTVKVCEFCGVEVAIEPPPQQQPPQQPRVQQVVVHQFRSPQVPVRSQGNPGVVLAVIGAVVGLSVAGVVAATTLARSSSRASESSIDPITGIATPAGKTREPISQLHTTPFDWTSDVPIESKEMVGSISSFDVLANWDFALRVGHAWWEDAELYEIAADPVGKNGVSDLSTNGRVDYHLVSKLCRADHQKRAETEKGLKDNSCSLDLTIDKDGPSVRLDLIAVDNTGRSTPLQKPACNIQQAFDEADRIGKLTKRPAYQIRLVHDVFGLEYRISNASSVASMDGVDISPTFCVAKGGATKSATTTTATTAVPTPQPTAQSQQDVPFDQNAARSAVKNANASAVCASKAGPTGAGRVNIVFAPNGTVSSAKAQPPFAGTDRGTCWEKTYSAIKVPPFTGSPVTISSTIIQ